MTYKATIWFPYDTVFVYFTTMTEAEQWLDSVNRDKKCKTMIETFEAGRKIDGFFYT